MTAIDEQIHLGCTFGELTLQGLLRFPEHVGIVAGARQFTYRQIVEAISRVIQALKAHGVQRGQGIAQLSSNAPEVLFVWFAAAIMGLRYTPLHPLGSEDDQAFILEDAEITALVVDAAAFADRGRALEARIKTLTSVFTVGPADYGIDLSAEMAKCRPGPVRVEAQPEDICTLNYTGGTTGRPKGVILPNRVHVAARLAMLTDVEWPHPPRFLVATPISHASGGFITPVFLLGGTVYLEAGFDPEGFMRAIERHRINTAFLVPTMIYMLLDHPQIRRIDLSSLETVLYAAAPMSPVRIAEALDIFGQVFVQGYGQTESPYIFTVLRKQDHDTANMARLGSCGRPVAGACVRILDDQLNEAPTGEIGEICIRSPQVMDGYWKRPQETADAFRGGWLHTGDMARRDEEGFIYIVDRAKDMIISGGFNVFPREIEDVLAQHPAVSMSTVIGVPDEKWGEQVKAIVVLRPEARVTAEELIRLVREKKGAVYAPKSVDFAESLPVTALGKADRKQLRAKYWQGEARQVH